MVDISYNKDQFLEKKLEIPDEALLSKYTLLYTTLDCFQQTYTIPISKKTTTKTVPHERERKFQTRHVQQSSKSTAKRLTSILNVLNESNYEKQVQKLLFLVKNDEIPLMVNTILETCIIHIFYIKLFIKMIKHISQHHKEQTLAAIDQFVDNFFKSNIEFIIKEKTQDSSNTISKERSSYELFCLRQKFKHTVIATATVVLYLIKEELTSFTIKDFDQYITNQLTWVVIEDDFTVDILFQIVMDAKNIVQWHLQKSIDLNLLVSNNKLKFLLEKINE